LFGAENGVVLLRGRKPGRLAVNLDGSEMQNARSALPKAGVTYGPGIVQSSAGCGDESGGDKI
jgi:hypothetical protein